ncbi:MAG: CrcB family protein, partial [Actinomycetota bacterium]|nr:CrcB family protein [Actinomycetota bacterium]
MTQPSDRHRMPTDSDFDVNAAGQRQELNASHGAVLGIIALGGAIGALARFQIGRWLPTPVDGFPV